MLFVSKAANVGNVPVNFRLGVEHSMVSQGFFSQEALIKLGPISVIHSLINHPFFGGSWSAALLPTGAGP